MTREEEIRQAWFEEKKRRVGTGEMVHFDSFLLGALYADEHPKNPWRDTTTDEPKKDQDVFAYIPNFCGGEYCKLTYLGNYRWSQDEGEYTTEFYDNNILWMPIPELPKKGGEA